MNAMALTKILDDSPDKKLSFVLPNGSAVPAHFHITEVGHVQKNFIDCGGTRRSVESCVLQAWVAENDEEHSLGAGKLASIIKLASKIFPLAELPVEIEFEAPYISQFPIDEVETDGEVIIFRLASKHTDCLAKEQCGLEGASSCCSTESDCCK